MGPKTGYELQKKIEKSISHFWPSTQSQIYRTLNAMSAEKLILSEIHYQDERPNKKLYSITKKGKEELLQWLSEPIAIPKHRNNFLIQLFFSQNINTKTIQSNLFHYKTEMEKRLAFLKSDEVKSMMDTAENKTERFLYELINDNGIHVLKSEIKWAEESTTKLKNIEEFVQWTK